VNERNQRETNDNTMRERFRKFAHTTSQIVGSPWSFLVACAVICAWALTGPHFRYNDTWQLVINTGTTIVTFLMVFLIQNTQNRDARAMHLKLDELIRALKGARNQLVNLEEMSDEELDELQKEFHRVCGARKQKVRTKAPAEQAEGVRRPEHDQRAVSINAAAPHSENPPLKAPLRAAG
jgi:low affinity Fe/Cu permease